jgi:glycine betaine/proline transport system substrate-binding protein
MYQAFTRAMLGLAGLGLVAALGLGAPANAGSVPESSDPIKLAVNEWTGQHISTHLTGEILKKMGYNVEYVTAGYYPQMTALEDNTITATLEIWSSNIGDLYDNALASGNVVEVGPLGIMPQEAWMYPAYVEEQCPGLPNWEALKDCGDLFAVPETFPKGRFLDYPADWGATNVDRINALGLNLTSVPAGTEGSLVAEIKSAVSRKDPLLVQFWTPHWIHAFYDLRIVQLPTYGPGCHDDPSWGVNPDETWDCDWELGYVKKMAWVGMEEKWPAAYRLLKNFTLTNEIQVAMMAAIDSDGRAVEEVVKEWLDANEATWRPWIDDALM